MAFYDDIPNVSGCSNVEQLYECALLVINNSKLLRDWLNGSETTNVTLGGKSSPSLRQLIQNINRVAGIATSVSAGAVKPDNVTTKVDALGVLSVIAAGIIKSGGGLVAGADGKLLVDFSTMPASQLSAMLSSLIQTGGGLSVNSEGKFYFDAQSMDTAVFDNMLKKLRLPKWLTANKNFYVDNNHANASDTLGEGRGESASKPFKTIQACVNYVCDNYNVGPYTVFIKVADGNYNPVVLGDFSRTTGRIVIEPVNPFGVSIISSQAGGIGINCSDGVWEIRYFNINMTPNYAGVTTRQDTYACRSSGNLSLLACHIKISCTGNPSSYTAPAILYGNISVNLDNEYNNVFELEIPQTSNNLYGRAFLLYSGNSLSINKGEEGKSPQIYMSGNFDTILLCSGGAFEIATLRPIVPVFAAVSQKSITGKRYSATGGGKINTGGQGPDYFPGTIAGTVESSTYSWYK